MSPDSISCIVPVRDGAPYIGEALDSIFAQSHQPSEVIVVDDGSTDGTRGVVKRYGDKLQYLFCSMSNPAAARNIGIQASSGALLAFLDADDTWHPDKLALQLAHLQSSPGIALCVCQVQNFVAPGTIDESAESVSYGTPVPGFVADALLTWRETFDTVGLFDESLPHAATLDWFVKARDRGLRDSLLPEVLVYRRLHGSNLSIKGASASRRAHLSVIRAAVERRLARSANESTADGDQFNG